MPPGRQDRRQGGAVGDLHDRGAELTLRHAGPDDAAFLAVMLAEAMAWRPGSPRPPDSTVSGSRYVRDWPRSGDGGLLAIVRETTEAIGAAWYRLMAADDPGYGYIDSQTPEISIGVVRAHRGRGVGRRLLLGLLELARAEGHGALSLSVEHDNFALGLYESLGFERVERLGNAWTLAIDLR